MSSSQRMYEIIDVKKEADHFVELDRELKKKKLQNLFL